MRSFSVLVLFFVFLPLSVGCGAGETPTVTSSEDELAQFLKDNPELAVDEEPIYMEEE